MLIDTQRHDVFFSGLKVIPKPDVYWNLTDATALSISSLPDVQVYGSLTQFSVGSFGKQVLKRVLFAYLKNIMSCILLVFYVSLAHGQTTTPDPNTPAPSAPAVAMPAAPQGPTDVTVGVYINDIQQLDL